MWDLLKNWLLYPLARFFFEFLGDHIWIAVVLVLLIAILIWRFCWPIVLGFWKLFGWQGVFLLIGSAATLGAFGAGWRAHRDSSLTPGTPEYHGNKPAKPTKPKKEPPDESADDYWTKVTHGVPLK